MRSSLKRFGWLVVVAAALLAAVVPAAGTTTPWSQTWSAEGCRWTMRASVTPTHLFAFSGTNVCYGPETGQVIAYLGWNTVLPVGAGMSYQEDRQLYGYTIGKSAGRTIALPGRRITLVYTATTELPYATPWTTWPSSCTPRSGAPEFLDCRFVKTLLIPSL